MKRRAAFAFLFILCSSVFTAWQVLSGPKLQLTLEMAASTSSPSMAQLFYNTGAGYNEKESEVVSVSSTALNDFQRFTFDLPSKTIIGLRFDPLTTHGAIIIRNLAIRDPRGSVMRLSPARLLPFNQIVTGVSEDSRQQITFNTLPDATDPGLIIRMDRPFQSQRFKALGRAGFIAAGDALLLAIFLFLYFFVQWLSPYYARLLRVGSRSTPMASSGLRQSAASSGATLIYQQIASKTIHSDHVQTRRLVRIALALLLVSLVFTCFERTSPPEVELSLEMSSSTPSLAQLFYDVGSGYSEKDSQTAVVPALSFHQLSFKLPRKSIFALRFDPLITEGRVVLRDVDIRTRHRRLVTIPVSDIKSLNQIKTRAEEGRQVTFSTVPGANDPSLIMSLRQPLDVDKLGQGEGTRTIIWGNGLLLCLGVLTFFASERLLGSWTWLRRRARIINGPVNGIAAQLSTPYFIEFDSAAIWFYIVCFAGFSFCAFADWNGSSISIYNSAYGLGAREIPLHGLPLGVRSDEWVCHTPAILNEDLSLHRFDPEHSSLGNHSIALMANVPVRHISTLFRPQFWGFFFLPVDYAFAFYWQFKGLVLILGVFTCLLLITQSTFWAATASLWFFFSAFTQWTYSWPSALPEMVGLSCTALVAACFLTVGRQPVTLYLVAVIGAMSVIDFALCGYPPHMIPLIWLTVFLFVAWCLANRDLIVVREASLHRLLAAVAMLAICTSTGLIVYKDAHVAIAAVARTAYPGKRIFSGGSLSLQTVMSHFLQWTETEAHFPPPLSNICEATGFLWLAPATLFCLSRVALSRFQKFALASLWTSFLLILLWLVVPFPSSVGAILGFDRTGGTRALPALGLANISIVVLCMSAMTRRERTTRESSMLPAVSRLSGIFLIIFSILLLTNQTLKDFFSWSELSLGACITTVLVVLVLEARKKLLALALIVPQAFLFAGVNPIERGLGVVTSSNLFHFIRGHDELRHGKWIVYSEGIVGSGFLRSSGCEVYTGFMYVPDIDHLTVFKDNGLDPRAFNRDGILLARPLPKGWKSYTEVPIPYAVRLNISPSDPMLKQLGIKYAAFEQRPADSISSQLIPLSSSPIGGIWMYQLK